MKKGQKRLLGLVALLLILVAVIFYFRDNTDTSEIEKKQIEDAQQSEEEMIDDLNDSFDE